MPAPKSLKADSATLDKVSKILPLLNSDNPAEAQAAAAALAKYDLREIAASLQTAQPSWDIVDQWRDEERKARQLRLDAMQKQAQGLLDTNSPLLTKIIRRSLHTIVQLDLNESRARCDLDYWSERLRVIRWQLTPGAKELENALSVAARHSQSAKNSVYGVFDAKARVRLVNMVATAKDALIKAEEQITEIIAVPVDRDTSLSPFEKDSIT